MTLLPPIPSSTVSAMYAAREAEHENFDSIGLPMSELGSECDRALWYSHRWASEHERLTGQKLRLFETGNIEEHRLIDDLRRVPGVTVVDIDHETGKQFKVYSIGGHLRGKLDGKVYGLPEAPKTWHVLECKSHNDKNFKAIVKKSIKESKPAHWWQCQKYMELTGLDRCLYIAVNKNTDELHAERVHYDAAAVMQLNVRLERIITQNTAPSRISEDPNSFLCMWCRHKAVCHREAFGRQHCRTCLNSTPIVDHNDTSAPWLCEKFGRTLSLDEQRAGCHAHLYLPDTVPGDQFDSGDDWVAYRMRDGSTWTDQEKKAPEEPPACEVCGGSQIEMINGGHGNVIEAPCSMCQPPSDCALCGAASNQNCHMSGAFRHCPRDLGKVHNTRAEQRPADACDVCQGSGEVSITHQSFDGDSDRLVPDCVEKDTCEECGGNGHTERYRYWYRPSTGEVWSTEFASHDSLVSAGEVEELTAEEYTRAAAYYAGLHVESKQ